MLVCTFTKKTDPHGDLHLIGVKCDKCISLLTKYILIGVHNWANIKTQLKLSKRYFKLIRKEVVE